MALPESLKPLPGIDFIFLNSDVSAFYPKIERFVEIRKSSRYHKFKHLLDTSKNDLIGEQDKVYLFIAKEIDGYQGWVYCPDGLILYQIDGSVSMVEN